MLSCVTGIIFNDSLNLYVLQRNQRPHKFQRRIPKHKDIKKQDTQNHEVGGCLGNMLSESIRELFGAE